MKHKHTIGTGWKGSIRMKQHYKTWGALASITGWGYLSAYVDSRFLSLPLWIISFVLVYGVVYMLVDTFWP